jgi:hypothetical protein
MNCQAARASAYDYFEHRLALAARAAVDAHVSGCASCGELWKIARETTCREFAQACGEFLERELSPERRSLFERHLSICAACVEYLASYQRTVALARESGAVDEVALAAVEARLLDALRTARERPH